MEYCLHIWRENHCVDCHIKKWPCSNCLNIEHKELSHLCFNIKDVNQRPLKILSTLKPDRYKLTAIDQPDQAKLDDGQCIYRYAGNGVVETFIIFNYNQKYVQLWCQNEKDGPQLKVEELRDGKFFREDKFTFYLKKDGNNHLISSKMDNDYYLNVNDDEVILTRDKGYFFLQFKCTKKQKHGARQRKNPQSLIGQIPSGSGPAMRHSACKRILRCPYLRQPSAPGKRVCYGSS